MAKPLLLLGAGVTLDHACRAGRAAGVPFVIPPPETFPEGSAVDIEAVCRLAHESGAGYVYPCSMDMLVASAHANVRLGVPGIAADTAARLVDKARMHERLAETGFETPAWKVVRSMDEVSDAAREFGLPAILKPVDGHRGRGVRILEHIEDASLFVRKAVAASASGRALFEEYLIGAVYRIEGEVESGRFAQAYVSRALDSPWPMCHEMGFVMPVSLPEDETAGLIATAQDALAALDLKDGSAIVELIHDHDDTYVISVSACPSASPTGVHLAPVAYGVNWVGESLRRAAGFDRGPLMTQQRAASMFWMSSGTGIVEGVEGLETVRPGENVVEATSQVVAGEVLGHVHDIDARERIGYVIAAGSTPDAAIDSARWAWARCRVVARPTR